MTDKTIRTVIREDSGYINLRGDASNESFCQAVHTALGQDLPVEPNTLSPGTHDVFWLGPDEWLVATGAAVIPALVDGLRQSLSGMHAAVNDVSGGNITYRVAGAAARDLFAKGCTLDFHPDVFRLGACAQSGLGKAPVLIGLIDDTPTFDVIVRRSFADYLHKWLRHAGREYGIEFR